MGLPRYNVASYLTLSYYRDRPSHSAPRTTRARPSVASAGSSHGVNSSTGAASGPVSDGEKCRIDVACTRFDLKIVLPHHVRLENRASPHGDSYHGFSFAIPSPGCIPFRSHQVEPSYLSISFLSRRICERAPSRRAKLESGTTNLV